MLDIRFIRENPELVADHAVKKGYKHVDVAHLLSVDAKRREAMQQIDVLREERNTISNELKAGPQPALIERGKALKDQLVGLESALQPLETEYEELINQIPNILQPDVPIGGEEDSVEIKTWGDKRTDAVDHLDFATARDWVDFERGAKVAGAKFYFLKGDLALLENAITQFALSKILKNDFTYLTVPAVAKGKIATGTGFAPRTSDQSDEYYIEPDSPEVPNDERLSLIATAEVALTGYHADEIIDEAKLPLFYAALSPSFRKEAGTYGKHARGLFRVHQFNKLEMYAFTTPEQSVDVHAKILAIEEEIWQELGIPYHIINIASGDLGAPASKKYDIEYWSPVDEKYRELTSCSNCTDFQARNLNIRVRRTDGRVEVLHTLNGTAVSLARSLVAIIENYQNDDGTLTVPEALRPYMGGREIL